MIMNFCEECAKGMGAVIELGEKYQRPQECEHCKYYGYGLCGIHLDTRYDADYCILDIGGDYCPDFTPKTEKQQPYK